MATLTEPMGPHTGAIGLVRTGGFVGAAIRLLTRSQVNHAFIVCGDDGQIVESQARGAVLSNLSGYDAKNVVYSGYWGLTLQEERAVVAAAKSLLGVKYGFLDIAALALVSVGIRWKWLAARVQREDRLICSQLADRAYALAGIHLFDDGRLDGSVTPGDLLMLVASGAEIVE